MIFLMIELRRKIIKKNNNLMMPQGSVLIKNIFLLLNCTRVWPLIYNFQHLQQPHVSSLVPIQMALWNEIDFKKHKYIENLTEYWLSAILKIYRSLYILYIVKI